MNPYELFVLTDDLLSNWAKIRVLMGRVFEVKKEGLNVIASQLQSERLDEAELEQILLQLRIHLKDTKAEPYFEELIERSGPSELYGIQFSDFRSELQLTRHLLGQEIARSTYIRHIPVFFATNRARTDKAQFAGEGDFRETQGLRMGNANVTVPLDADIVAEFDKRIKPTWFANEK